MATLCPLCKKANLTQKANNPKDVRCSNYRPKKIDGEFVNTGECDFHINFKSNWGTLDAKKIVSIVNGNKLKNKDGATISLDLENTDFYTKIEFSEDVFVEV